MSDYQVKGAPTPYQLAQIGHSLAGALFILLVPALWPHIHHGWLYGLLAWCAWVFPKEFWYDLHFEHPQTFADSLKDFFYYALGACVALLALELTRGLA